MPIESSTVTHWCRPPVWSASVRPIVGMISARRPVTAWEEFSLVDTWTVRSTSPIACSVTRESGVARTKLPPMPMKNRTLPVAHRPDRFDRTAMSRSALALLRSMPLLSM